MKRWGGSCVQHACLSTSLHVSQRRALQLPLVTWRTGIGRAFSASPKRHDEGFWVLVKRRFSSPNLLYKGVGEFHFHFLPSQILPPFPLGFLLSLRDSPILDGGRLLRAVLVQVLHLFSPVSFSSLSSSRFLFRVLGSSDVVRPWGFGGAVWGPAPSVAVWGTESPGPAT